MTHWEASGIETSIVKFKPVFDHLFDCINWTAKTRIYMYIPNTDPMLSNISRCGLAFQVKQRGETTR